MGCHSRDSIKTGDLLAWSEYTGEHTSFWLNTVRFLTMSEFGHVSVAWRIGGRLYHVEAVIPRIRVVPVPEHASFFHLPLSDEFPNEPVMEDFFNDKIGSPYSIHDAIRAYLGLSVKADNAWQCAELALAYYTDQGLDLCPRAITPSRIVYAALDEYGVPLMRINANKPCPFTKESIQNG